MPTLRQQFFSHLSQTSDSPIALEISRAEGCNLYDQDGRSYLDLISGISVSNLGHHCKPILEAIRNQLDDHLHLMVYGEYIISPQVKLAAKLASLLPSNFSSVYFTNSGTEATEGAMKLAKRATGRTEIISFRNAYHGSTQGSLSICGNEELKNAFRPLLPGITILDFDNIDQLKAISKNTACVIVEPIQGESGILVPSNKFLVALSECCKENGALLVFDEIQTGMARTGSLFAFEHSGVVPDILLIGKAFGGGLPLGAFISSKELMNNLSFDPVLGHLTTFGGHPLCCAAALAALEELAKPGLLENVRESEKLFRSLLVHSRIKQIRGKGLFLALVLENGEVCRQVVRNCLDKGMIADWFLFAPECLRICPPLIITEQEIKKACSILIDVLDSI